MDLKTLRDTPPWDWPQDAHKVILEVLADRQADALARELAAEMAGDFVAINDELVDALLAILHSGEETTALRARAAISLGPILEHGDTSEFDDLDDDPISEHKFHEIQDALEKLYPDVQLPKEVRRRILEASVRAPLDWHHDAIDDAYRSDDEDWQLTAVFSMGWVRGFDDRILEALGSSIEDIHYEAVCAAGNWELDAAWSHVRQLVSSPETDKLLLLAAIDAVGSIRPHEAGVLLVDLTDSDDEDIVEAAHEAMAMAEVLSGLDEDEFDEDDFDSEDVEEGRLLN